MLSFRADAFRIQNHFSRENGAVLLVIQVKQLQNSVRGSAVKGLHVGQVAPDVLAAVLGGDGAAHSEEQLLRDTSLDEGAEVAQSFSSLDFNSQHKFAPIPDCIKLVLEHLRQPSKGRVDDISLGHFLLQNRQRKVVDILNSSPGHRTRRYFHVCIECLH